MSALAIKIKTKAGESIVRGLTSKNTVSELKDVISKLTQIEPERLIALKGFPPKPLNFLCTAATLEAMGITSGDTLIIEELSQDAVKPLQNHELSNKDGSSGMETPKLPCKALPGPSASRPTSGPSTNQLYMPIALQGYLNASDGILRKQLIPADNSCLFTSLGFALHGIIDTSSGLSMRAIVSEVIKGEPDVYSEAMLGKPNPVYCAWILRPESWGGGIELSILCNIFEFEIAVVNVVSGNMSLFGEDRKYTKRAFLIFDGIHYDALYLEPTEVGSRPIQTLFKTADDAILAEVKRYMQTAKANHEYVDLIGFKLRCNDCKVALTGQEDALKHAMLTGHQNFGEIVR